MVEWETVLIDKNNADHYLHRLISGLIYRTGYGRIQSNPGDRRSESARCTRVSRCGDCLRLRVGRRSHDCRQTG